MTPILARSQVDATLKQTCLHRGASCVQRFNDSQIHANRTTYRTLLRSSSLQEPRDPLLKVVHLNHPLSHSVKHSSVYIRARPRRHQGQPSRVPCKHGQVSKQLRVHVHLHVHVQRMQHVQHCGIPTMPLHTRTLHTHTHSHTPTHSLTHSPPTLSIRNDPSAGSPTETLLRLLLPLNDQVCPISHQGTGSRPPPRNPKASLSHSIGSSDGRCVQRAGT